MDARASSPQPFGLGGTGPGAVETGRGAALLVLCAISLSHSLNDIIQSLVPAIYPVLKQEFNLDFGQIGLITLTFQLTASLLQPLVGIYTDRRPTPFSLPIGMGCTLLGLLLLSVARSFPVLLVAAAMIGMGSSVFHPESSRVARMASGGQHGFAQSLFQVGGNFGTALGPLLAAFIVVPRGQSSIAWFSVVAFAAIIILLRIGRWYRAHLRAPRKVSDGATVALLPRRKVGIAITVLMVLVFSKYFYLASITSYCPFYLMSKFGLDKQAALIRLFVFLAAVAAGTIVGGPLGDRFGRRLVIWVSILGVLPFTLLLPHADLFWTTVLSVVIGLILSSAFSAILVFAQELVPGRVGMVSGMFFGFAFGMGGLGAALLGALADHTSITFVYNLCAYLPALGLLAYFLPNVVSAKG
ncbi:MAG TPA: MFS transporter [Lichenihabitans sp.]|jgi:FSR family fosmidomycin resistance protein-like MFS transporter|nr:MFS transporter [Lichenihabitans sp.]